MKKKIKKYGDTLVISISREDAEIYEIKEGDIVELTLTKIRKPKK